MFVPDLVSIIIVCHDNWPDVQLAIQSALTQSYEPAEVIVVDNDSRDSTPQEVPKHFGTRVRYIRQANRGDSGGYNTGLAVASGEFIQLLDGDDFLAPDKIEKQVAVFAEEPEVDIVYGDMWQFQSRPGPAYWSDWDICEYPDILAFLIATGGRLPAHGMLYRSRLLRALGPFDETLYISDVDYWMRAAWAGYRFTYRSGAACFYRRHPRQMSANGEAMNNGRAQLWSKALSYVTAEPYRSAIAAQLARLRFYNAIHKTGLNTREALEVLGLARATSSSAITNTAYVLGAILILLPAGSWLARSKGLRPLRRLASSWLGLKHNVIPPAPRMK